MLVRSRKSVSKDVRHDSDSEPADDWHHNAPVDGSRWSHSRSHVTHSISHSSNETSTIYVMNKTRNKRKYVSIEFFLSLVLSSELPVQLRSVAPANRLASVKSSSLGSLIPQSEDDDLSRFDIAFEDLPATVARYCRGASVCGVELQIFNFSPQHIRRSGC